MSGDDAFAQQMARYQRAVPDTSQAAFVAPDAILTGAVTLGVRSSVWYGCILRADLEKIVLGEESNLQDGVVVHLADDYGVHVGAQCSVGHRAILHACQIGEGSLVGMGAIVMDGAVIGEESLVGAGALVLQKFACPPGSLVLGSPARVIRSLTSAERKANRELSAKYVQLAAEHHRSVTPKA
ncbi:MAG: gamma carbonic anhydrase family protein [Opitutales bacterium]|nr:gamma carbonic anhydrase family protein [Opitutales bacterium]